MVERLTAHWYGRITRSGRAAAAIFLAVILLMIGGTTVLQAAVDAETQFVFNTFSFLVWGALVMWMCAGFTMLESGSVRTKNASVICLKNIGLYAIAGLAYYFVGYNLMYVDVGSLIGSVTLFYGPSADEVALLAGRESARDAVIANNYAVMSNWFFQMVFVATAASIVSGALAERVRLWSFFLFTLILTAVIYPIVGAWTWGGGWLDALDFKDFAGSTIVHGTGGWAALAGALVVGPRVGKFRKDGSVLPTPPSNVPVVTLGVFILWFGWFGFNGGSQLALASAVDVVAMSNVLVNTNLAAAAGVVAVPAHLFAGVWGTLAASIAAGATLWVQIVGVLAVGAFVFTVSWLLWTAIEKTIGVRVTYNVEQLGQDAAELGIEAYPEFVLMPEPDDDA